MKSDDKKELERLRERKRRGEAYRNAYAREKYKRMTCVYPIARAAAVDKAMEERGAVSASAYLAALIDEDLTRRGLLDDGGASDSGASDGRGWDYEGEELPF